MKAEIEWLPLPDGFENWTFEEWMDFYERNDYPLFSDFLITVKERWRPEEDWEYNVDVAGYNSQNEFWILNDWDEGQELKYTHWAKLPKPMG